MQRLPSSQLGLLFDGRLGLVIGPGLTLGPGAPQQINAALAGAFEVGVGESYLHTGEDAVRSGVPVGQVRQTLRALFDAMTASTLPPRLSGLQLGAVLSYCPTNALEDHLRQEGERSPFRQPLISLDDPAIPIPPRSMPFFKVLGSAHRDTLVCTHLDYVKNRPRWRKALRAFMDQVRDGPVLCLGLADLRFAFQDLLAELSSSPGTAPKHLVVLDSDPLASTMDLDRLLDEKSTIISVSGSVSDLLQAAEAQTLTQYKSIGSQHVATGSNDELSNYADLGVYVNAQLQSPVHSSERQLLFELLFSPSVPKWDPFFHSVDFKRSASDPIRLDVLATIERQMRDAACVIDGPAATGKTVILKRIAFDIATAGHPVVWMRPYFYPDSYNRLQELFRTAARVLRKRHMVVFLDDPLAFGSLHARDIAQAARTHDVNIVLVMGVRTSDWSSQDPGELLGPMRLSVQESIHHTFDDDEWSRLVPYLTAIGVASSETDARAQLANVSSRSARDILSMLYWLIPNTRASIESSIQGEYFRLGDLAAFKRVVVGHATHSSAMLRDAYAMVAVADKYHSPLPVEVLVSALDVDYGSWLSAASPSDRLAWGLLYAEENLEAQSIVYRTRNDVVTRLLVEALNGGTIVQGGELRVLERLISGCDGSHPSYLEFCQRILVRNEAFDRLPYADGLGLYELALRTLPYPDKTLLHHKGIWIRTKGADPILAGTVLRDALRTPVAPYARRAEANEHIYTSLAAATIDAMEKGLISTEQGREETLAALAHARSDSFFNVSAVHVSATLALRLAQRLGLDSVDSSKIVSTAIADVDRTVLLLQGRASKDHTEDISMLTNVRQRIITGLASVTQLEAQAEEAWATYQNQEGFCLAGLAMLHEARKSAKGRLFRIAADYVFGIIKRIESLGKNGLPALHDVYVQTIYEWRIRGYSERPNSGAIDWERFLASILQVLPQESSPLYRYLEGLAHAHQGHWQEAQSVFSRIRQMRLPRALLWVRRDPLLDQQGAPMVIQCTVKRENQKVFLHADTLQTDFIADKEHGWPRNGEITLATVVFSFAGATAIPS